MGTIGTIRVFAVPYKKFKEKIKLTKKYEKEYSIEDLGGLLLMKARDKHERKV